MKASDESKIYQFIENLVLSNVTAFYPSLINIEFGYDPYEYIPYLNRLAHENVLDLKFIVRNPSNASEYHRFNSYNELPLGEYYDDFHFGEEFLLTDELVEVIYYINDEYKKKLKMKKEINDQIKT